MYVLDDDNSILIIIEIEVAISPRYYPKYYI